MRVKRAAATPRRRGQTSVSQRRGAMRHSHIHLTSAARRGVVALLTAASTCRRLVGVSSLTRRRRGIDAASSTTRHVTRSGHGVSGPSGVPRPQQLRGSAATWPTRSGGRAKRRNGGAISRGLSARRTPLGGARRAQGSSRRTPRCATSAQLAERRSVRERTVRPFAKRCPVRDEHRARPRVRACVTELRRAASRHLLP